MAGALPIIGLVTSFIGTGLSAYGSYREGQAQKAGYEYNAKVAEANAEAIRQKTAYEEVNQRKRLKALLGEQKAIFGAAGVDLTVGSPLLTMMEDIKAGERDIQALRYSGDVEATQQLNQARLNRFYGKQAGRAGIMGGASTFITGLGNAGTDYYRYSSFNKKASTPRYYGNEEYYR